MSAASDLMGLERRQVLRLSKAYQEHGATALISKKRGRASNRQTPSDIKARVLELIKARYADFGPTLAAEKLREVHGITIGRETLRLWMLDAGRWADRVKRRGRVYQPRYRRECVGELLQVDGSEHWWFEDRGPQCAFLPGFMADYNTRFAKAPFNDKDLHRPMQPRDRLDEAFTWPAERTLSQSLTLQYDNILFMIEPSEFAQAAIGRRVEVVDFPDGRLEVRYKGRSMPYRTFDKLRRVTETAVLENKRLGGLLTLIRESQQTQPPGMRTSKGPKRRDQTKHMFSVG